MTLNGADGETFVGIAEALRILPTDQSSINAAYRDLIELLLDTVSHYFGARVAGLSD